VKKSVTLTIQNLSLHVQVINFIRTIFHNLRLCNWK